jgi:lipid-A-disaccharide synthase
MKRYLILANGPGEVWGWARPLLREILRRGDLPELCLLPCQYASGREKEAVKACLAVEVSHLSIRKLLLEPRKGRYTGIIQLGGDLLFGRYFAWRYHCPLAVYTYGWKKGLRSCSLVATAFGMMQLRLKERGCPAFLTGDLVASALLEDPHDFTWHAPVGRRVVFFPGSRRTIRKAALLYARDFRLALLRDFPDVEITALLSPFSDPEELLLWEEEGFRAVSHDTGGVLAEADLALTQPGTNTLELLHTGTPGMVAVPDRFLSLIPLPGILGGLASIPLFGPWIRRLGIHYLRSSLKDYLAWPNRIGGREILPERIGPCLPGDLAREAGEFLGNPERRRMMRQELMQLREESTTKENHRNGAVRFMNILEEILE